MECKAVSASQDGSLWARLIGNIVECKVNNRILFTEPVPGLIGNIVECKEHITPSPASVCY